MAAKKERVKNSQPFNFQPSEQNTYSGIVEEKDKVTFKVSGKTVAYCFKGSWLEPTFRRACSTIQVKR